MSPPAVSGRYIAPGTSLLLQTDTGVFTPGLLVRGQLPPGAYGVQATFKAPGAPASEWDKNASRMMRADSAGRFTLKVAIGNGQVQFGVRTVAPPGSPLCETPPAATYQIKNAADYFHAPDLLPWPNPVSVVTNLIHEPI